MVDVEGLNYHEAFRFEFEKDPAAYHMGLPIRQVVSDPWTEGTIPAADLLDHLYFQPIVANLKEQVEIARQLGEHSMMLSVREEFSQQYERAPTAAERVLWEWPWTTGPSYLAADPDDLYKINEEDEARLAELNEELKVLRGQHLKPVIRVQDQVLTVPKPVTKRTPKKKADSSTSEEERTDTDEADPEAAWSDHEPKHDYNTRQSTETTARIRHELRKRVHTHPDPRENRERSYTWLSEEDPQDAIDDALEPDDPELLFTKGPPKILDVPTPQAAGSKSKRGKKGGKSTTQDSAAPAEPSAAKTSKKGKGVAKQSAASSSKAAGAVKPPAASSSKGTSGAKQPAASASSSKASAHAADRPPPFPLTQLSRPPYRQMPPASSSEEIVPETQDVGELEQDDTMEEVVEEEDGQSLVPTQPAGMFLLHEFVLNSIPVKRCADSD